MRRYLHMTLIIVLLILSACNSGPSENAIQTAISLTETAQPTITSTPTATYTPTSTNILTPTPTVTATPTPTNTATPTPRPIIKQDLEKALLTLEELPAGWSKSPPDKEKDDKATFSFLCKEYPKKAIVGVDADFQKSQLGPFLLSSISLYPPGEAIQQFEKLRATVDACPEVKKTEGGSTMTFKVAPMSFPKLGEQSFAIRVSSESILGFVDTDSVYFRIGDVIATLQYMTIGMDPIDSSQTEVFAKIFEQRLLGIIR